jgi:ATP-binding cassette subfamily F protein uup
MKLIGALTSPYVRKVRIVMAEKRLDFQMELEDVWNNDTIMKSNPLGKVPTLVMEGDGRVGDYVGGYSDWLRQRAAVRSGDGVVRPATQALPQPARASQSASPAATAAAPRRKLSFKLERELEQLPVRIEKLEAEIARHIAAMNDPAFYQQERAAIDAHNHAVALAQAELDAAYARWTELDAASE